MRTVCPSCDAKGNVPDEKLPPGGANIRCPSCSHIFFVGGELPGRDSAATSPITAPDASTEGSASEAPLPPPPAQDPDRSADGPDRELQDTEVVETVDWTAEAPEPSPTQVPIDAGESALGRFAGHTGPWKVKDPIGMVYTFADTESLRMWLTSRSTFEGLFVSPDEVSWEEVEQVAPLAGVRATGFSASRRAVTSQSAAQVLPAAKAGSRTSFSGAHEIAAAAADRVTRTPPSTRTRPAAVPAEARPLVDQSGSGAARRTATTGRMPTAADRRQQQRAEQSESKQATATVIRTVVLLVVLVGLAGFAATRLFGSDAPAGYPSTPAGERASWVVDALNDPVRLANLPTIQQQFASSALQETSAEEWRDLLTYYGGLVPAYEYQGVARERSPHELVVSLSTSLAHALELQVETETTPPFGILSIYIREVR